MGRVNLRTRLTLASRRKGGLMSIDLAIVGSIAAAAAAVIGFAMGYIRGCEERRREES
jgi:uncharacterized membrane protein (Fun14 family)